MREGNGKKARGGGKRAVDVMCLRSSDANETCSVPCVREEKLQCYVRA
jgi:hypothetical protein